MDLLNSSYLSEPSSVVKTISSHEGLQSALVEVLVEADKKQISKPIGPIPSRIKSAPVSFERNLQETEDWKKLLKTNKLSQEDFKTSDEDAFKLFVNFKQKTLFPKQRPESTPEEISFFNTRRL
ncbi:hypothetical protein Btru_040357 [Bulinus truncatus]|nr:hypothetical protein Btru_040357 [Bulinus truncatus]